MPKDTSSTAPDPAFNPISQDKRPSRQAAQPKPAQTKTGSRAPNNLLGLEFKAPAYEEWHKNRQNAYTEFWTPNIQVSTNGGQGLLSFSIAKGENKNFQYETEHIYDIQNISSFFLYMNFEIKKYLESSPKPALKSGAATFDGPSGNSFWTTVFESKASTWTTFPEWTQSLQTPKALFSNCLAGGSSAKPGDFVYLEKAVNGRKGTLFGGRRPSVAEARELTSGGMASKAFDLLTKLGEVVLVARYLEDTNVAAIYKSTSQNVLQQVKALQAALSVSNKGLFSELSKMDWAGHYAAWETLRLNEIGKNMSTFKDEAFTQASKWLDLALTEQKRSGRGQGTATFDGIQDLKMKVDTASERDELCPDTLFTFPKLRQTYDLTPNSAMRGAVTTPAPQHLPSTGIAPPPPAVVPPPKPTQAELRDRRAQARERHEESTILPAATGSPAPIPQAAPVTAPDRSPAANFASSVAGPVATVLAQNFAAPAAMALAPTLMSTLGPAALKTGVKLAFQGATGSSLG